MLVRVTAGSDLREVFVQWKRGALTDDEAVEFVAALPRATPDPSLAAFSAEWLSDFADRQADPRCRQFAWNAVGSGWFPEPLASRLLEALRPDRRETD